MSYLFDKTWFKKHQCKLLWLLNTPLIRIWFRWVMRFKKYGWEGSGKITKITPNSIAWGDNLIWNINKKRLEIERTEHFYNRNENSRRLYSAFKPLWYLFHAWDLGFANIFAPQLNLGFDTLTVYPDANPESTSVDGRTESDNGLGATLSWSQIVASAGNGAADTETSTNYINFTSANTSNKWANLLRSIFLFDTSALTSSATISAAVLSLYGTAKSDGASWIPNIDIYTSNPSSNTSLTGTDFSTIGTTSQTGSPISYADFNTSGYNDFTFNATGRGNISKTSISKFAARNASYDVSDSSPTWATGGTRAYLSGYYADNGSNKPKLVITYTLETTTSQVISNLLTLNVG